MQTFHSEFAQQLLTNQRLQDIIFQRLSGEIEVQAEIILGQHPQLSQSEASQYGFIAVLNNLAMILGEYYNVDIYVVIDRELRDPASRNTILSLYYNSGVQGPPNDPHGQTPSRPSIVIIHVGGDHFEIIGRVDTTPGQGIQLITNFNSGEPLIRRLY